jgi:hypothetical protein
MSRKTDYKPEYAREAKNYCLMGAIDEDLATFFGVTRRTIMNWKKHHPEFREAIEQGGKPHSDSKVIGRAFEKCMEGDSTMLIFWLKNRLGWRDRQDTQLTGANGEQLVFQISTEHTPKQKNNDGEQSEE